MATDAELLERFKPRVLYDSLEAFFADCPAELTDNPGNRLLGETGNVIAEAGSGLDLDFLGPKYPGEAGQAAKSHRLSIPGKNYRSQYVALVTERPELRDWVFGRVWPEKATDTKWLQYWFFYFYDDPSLAAKIGVHEGDWEMIQIRVRKVGEDRWEPSDTVYAQHNYAGRRDWRDVQSDGDRPLVYSARGSHASYFEAGLYDTRAWFDVADGKGPSPELRLVILDDKTQTPRWAYWPGVWGDTVQGQGWLPLRLLARIERVRRILNAVQSSSPTAPCKHKMQWSDPDRFLAKAEERDALEPTTRAQLRPEVPVTLERRGRSLHYDYVVAPDGWPVPPRTLVVTVAGEPQRVFTVELGGKRKRSGIVPSLKLEAGTSYEVTTSFMGDDGYASAPSPPVTIEAEPRRWRMSALGFAGYMFALAVDPIRRLRARFRATRQLGPRAGS